MPGAYAVHALQKREAAAETAPARNRCVGTLSCSLTGEREDAHMERRGAWPARRVERVVSAVGDDEENTHAGRQEGRPSYM